MKSGKINVAMIITLMICSFIGFFGVKEAHAEVAFGNAKGDITMIEYFDYNCPICRGYAPYINTVASENSNLKVIQRVVPVLDINTSQVVDRAVLASFYQNKFAEMQDAIFHVHDPETISPSEVFAIAQSIGLNQEQLINDMQSQPVTQQLIDNIKSFETTKQTSVPVMVFYRTNDPNHRIQMSGTHSLEEIQSVINQLEGEN